MTSAGMPPEVEFGHLVRSRASLLWIVTSEERRVEAALLGAVARLKGYAPVLWDCASGAVETRIENGKAIDKPVADLAGHPGALLEEIRKRERRRVWVLRDLDPWLAQDPLLVRAVKTAAREAQDELDANRWFSMVVLTASPEVPAALKGVAVVLDWPLPTRQQVSDILAEWERGHSEAHIVQEGERDAVVDAAVGLAASDVENAFALSMARGGKILPAPVAAEKKRVVDRVPGLTWYEPDPRGLSAIGGLERLKRDLLDLAQGLSPEARAYGLQPPRGVFLVGVPGCGKSLTAKAVPAAWGGLPLIRLDLGALKGGLVGQSEANIRSALKTAEAVAPVVLWADELEKGIAGATGYSGDSGVAADQLGTILTWLQERAGSVFFVATCNDVTSLPPELSRAGRFDATYFVDLPSRRERPAILAATLAAHQRPLDGLDLDLLAGACPDFSGAELASLVPAAMRRAFRDGARPLKTSDLLDVAAELVPIAKSSQAKIEALRRWGSVHARPASDPDVPESTPSTAGGASARRLDLEGA